RMRRGRTLRRADGCPTPLSARRQPRRAKAAQACARVRRPVLRRQRKLLHLMPRTFTITVPIRWSDLDLNGHVNHARIATLLEESRLAWRRSAVANDGIDTFE